jgi:hypothetical protein
LSALSAAMTLDEIRTRLGGDERLVVSSEEVVHPT